ncbi:hypothetical protein DPMN_024809 [Dreissena polymorpha]|uniref:Uncharacterized protein n=1 Tax=Dreissena polymorpha TaxID=45954 RepID=A0A9D4RCP7_DREPO|nr:hypothetical protein DPMN_024555 [Dreissena polymorpha]KAH3861857.1 hypothetical protein DPMN_024809 [Dreissena polymorpha]
MFRLFFDKSIPISFNHQRNVNETSMNLLNDVSLSTQMLQANVARSTAETGGSTQLRRHASKL